MAVTFQFNKISMQGLQKHLKMRQAALPTLKSKEAALRTTLKKQKDTLEELQAKFDEKMTALKAGIMLWAEFPFEIFSLKNVALKRRKVAGVSVYDLEEIDFSIAEISSFLSPAWVPSGVQILKALTSLIAALEIMRENMAILEYARRKTTQKVNLYEKVQIPEYRDAIQKIKRYLEDVENLEKAAQKITKQRYIA